MKREELRKILRGKCISDVSCEAAIDSILDLYSKSESEKFSIIGGNQDPTHCHLKEHLKKMNS